MKYLLLSAQVCSRAGKIEEALDVFKETVRQHNVVTVGSFNRCVSGQIGTFVKSFGNLVRSNLVFVSFNRCVSGRICTSGELLKSLVSQ